MKIAAACASALVLGACTSTGTTERNAAYGAAAGAVAGGLAGATKGCIESEDCDAPGIKDQADERDTDGDRHVDAYDRHPNDRYR